MRKTSSVLFALSLLAACAGAPAPPPAPAPPVPTAVAVPVDAAPVAVADAGVDAAPSRGPWPYTSPVVTRSPKGMVVSDNAIATKVGADILAAGGNAADAAVATAFALAVAYPTAGNIGGGGFAVTRMHGEVRALDFRETAPAAATRDMYLNAEGKPKPEAREGIKSVGVPGSVAGLWELHQKLGSKKKTWAELLAPAIALAENGFVIEEGFLSSLETAGKRLQKHPVSAALFYPGGNALAKGTTFKNPELAAVLKRIEKGPKGFYEGATADAIVAQMKAEGGIITLADLKKYQAKWRKPVEVTYRGHKITSMPPPSSGGVTLAMICHILEAYDLEKLGFQSPEELHFVFEAMRRSFAARNAKLGDPDFVKMPIDQLLSDSWAREQRATIAPDRATPLVRDHGCGPGERERSAHHALLRGRRRGRHRRADHHHQLVVRLRRHREGRRVRPQQRDGRLRRGARDRQRIRPGAGRSERDHAPASACSRRWRPPSSPAPTAR